MALVNIKQIATDIGVSAATVSNALNGNGRVSADMIDRIKDRAEKLGYRPSITARALKTGKTGILGLVMPDLTNPLFPRIAQTLSLAAEQRGMGILIGDSRGSADEQSEALRRLVDRGVDGLLVVPQKGTSPDLMPVSTVIINTASDPRNSVSADHAGGGALVAQHISGLGHKSVVILGGDPVSEVQRDRIVGMKDALPADVTAQIVWGDSGIVGIPRRIAQGATAIMTTSDLLALQVLTELTRAEYAVPRDVSLTGFDDMSLASIMHPPLTTVAQDVEQMAERAIDILTLMIRDKPVPETGETISMRLVVRESTSPLIN